MDSKNIYYVMDSCPAYNLPEQFSVARDLRYFYKQTELFAENSRLTWNNRIYFINGDDSIMSENVDSTFGKFIKRTCYDLNNNTPSLDDKKNVYISGFPNNFDKKQLDEIAKIEDIHLRECMNRTYREMFGSMSKIISRLRDCGGYDIHGFVDCKFIKPEDFLFFIDGDGNIDCCLKTDTTIGGFIRRVCTEITI